MAASRWAVGSSSTRIAGFASSARASKRRWRCPPDSADPSGPARMDHPPGSRGDELGQAGPAGDLIELVVGRIGTDQSQVVAQCGVEDVVALQ